MDNFETRLILELKMLNTIKDIVTTSCTREKALDRIQTYITDVIDSIENLNMETGNGKIRLTADSKEKLLELLTDMKTYNEQLLKDL